MDTFLTKCRQQFLTRVHSATENSIISTDDNRVTVVLGNESCDLDTVVSSLCMAYYLHKMSLNGRDGDGLLCIPVLNISQCDFHTHRDCITHLTQHNITPEQLLFTDQINLHRLAAKNRLTLVLVDHHTLPAGDLEILAPSVNHVIDHRPKSDSCKTVLENCEDPLLEIVGSCSTLITETILKHIPEILDDKILSSLLLGAITLDTVNFSRNFQQTTERDIAAGEILKERAGIDNTDTLYNTLLKARRDLSGLNTEDIFRKDLKIVSNNSDMCVAMSSIPMSLEEFIKTHEAVDDELTDILSAYDYTMCLLLFIDHQPPGTLPRRQLAIFGGVGQMRQQLLEQLLALKQPDLQLSTCPDTNISHMVALYQHNISASRKQILPAVERFVSAVCLPFPPAINQRDEDVTRDSDVGNSASDGLLDMCPNLLSSYPKTPPNSFVDSSPITQYQHQRIDREDIEQRLRVTDPPSPAVLHPSEESGVIEAGLKYVVDDNSVTLETQDDSPSDREGHILKFTLSDVLYSKPELSIEREKKEELVRRKRQENMEIGQGGRRLIKLGPETLKQLSVDDGWQDDELPAELSEELDDLEGSSEETAAILQQSVEMSMRNSEKYMRRVPPSTLEIGGSRPTRRRVPLEPNISVELDDIENTPEELDGDLEWDDDLIPTNPSNISTPEVIPELSAEDELFDRRNARRWRFVKIGDTEYTMDLRVIAPYRSVLSHGGYYGENMSAIIVFSSCFLPERTRKDYRYVMQNLFLYVVSTLELLVVEDYIIIYFNGGVSRRNMPSFSWLKKCYMMIDRKLRKNLKNLYLIHPDFWLRALIRFSSFFTSAKFQSKMRLCDTLGQLAQEIPMDYVYIPEPVKDVDMKRLKDRSPYK